MALRMDEEKLSAMATEVQRLNGEVKRLSSDVSRLEARIHTIGEMLDQQKNRPLGL